MIIDFHTHAFPDKLAPKVLPLLASRVGYAPYGDGTVSDLISTMDRCAIDRAVVCNIATNPKQQNNVNSFALETGAAHPHRLISLGSVNPFSDAIDEALHRLKEAGVPGIKLHPDYMEVTIDDPAFDPIFDRCTENGMFIIIHAGFDVCSPDKIHADPDMILRRLRRNPDIRLVCAHFGGNRLWDEVEQKLIGKNLWFDTSLGMREGLTREQARRMILNHDPSKVLFGTDFPWCDPRMNIDFIRSLDLGEEMKENVFHRNAEALLGL